VWQDKAMSTPVQFKWVTAREECSLKKVFEQLRLEVKDDVGTRNAQVNLPEKFTFSETGGKLSVYREHDKESPSVVFVLSKDCIQIETGNGDQPLKVTLTLNDEGECKPMLNGQICEFWQVRQRALEKLFFAVP
jgi:hypothetical protein